MHSSRAEHVTAALQSRDCGAAAVPTVWRARAPHLALAQGCQRSVAQQHRAASHDEAYAQPLVQAHCWGGTRGWGEWPGGGPAGTDGGEAPRG